AARNPGPGPSSSSGESQLSLARQRRVERGQRRLDAFRQCSDQHAALTLGQLADRLGLDNLVAGQELAASGAAPSTLAGEQIAHRPAARLLRAVDEHFCGGYLAER